jgi:hypothetical protein
VSLQKVAVVATEKGLSSDFSLKQPSMWFWKREWRIAGKEPGIYFELFGFAPADYGKDVEEYPSMWVMTDEFSRLRMREGSEEFGRCESRAAPELLGSGVTTKRTCPSRPWGRDCTEVSESDRVRAWWPNPRRWASSSSSAWTSSWNLFPRSIRLCRR